MPTYNYKCAACGHEFETQQSIHDDALTECPKCHKNELSKVITNASRPVFRGGGWTPRSHRPR